MEEQDHVPKNAGGLKKLETARQWILPHSLQKEHSLVEYSLVKTLLNFAFRAIRK
jgi:hypothetical protein